MTTTIHLRENDQEKPREKTFTKGAVLLWVCSDIFTALLYQSTDKNKNRTGCQNSCGQDMQY